MMFAGAVQTELHSTSSHLWRSAVTKEKKSIPDPNSLLGEMLN